MVDDDSQKYQRVVWVDAPGPHAHVRIRTDVNIPNPKAEEVLIKLEYTGVW